MSRQTAVPAADAERLARIETIVERLLEARLVLPPASSEARANLRALDYWADELRRLHAGRSSNGDRPNG